MNINADSCSYEQMRLFNIQKNMEMMANLGLEQSIVRITCSPLPYVTNSCKVRGPKVKRSRPKKARVTERRSSARLQGKEAAEFELPEDSEIISTSILYDI